MKALYFKVANLPFKATVPEHWDFAQLLPAFDAFYTQACSEEELLFSADFNNGALPEEDEEKIESLDDVFKEDEEQEKTE